MPLFYFNVRDGISRPDYTGTVLANWHEARVTAVRFAGEIIRDEAQSIALGEDWHVEVMDADRVVLFRFHLVTHEAPASSSQQRAPGDWL